MTTPRDAELVEAYRSGASLRQLVPRFGVTVQRCHQIVTEHGASRQAPQHRLVWTEPMDAALRRLRARGIGIDPIALRLGVTRWQVIARLRALALPTGRDWRRRAA